MNDRALEKEWKQMIKSENAFIRRNISERSGGLQDKISQYVPEGLSDNLNYAFLKAFTAIFDSGTGLIEKTYDKAKLEREYQYHVFEAKLNKDTKSSRAIGKRANKTKHVNFALSAVEGVGMGFIGMGIPDVPLFLGLLLKGVYEIALSYGFTYDSWQEQIFIMKLIEVSLSHGDALVQENAALNRFIWEPGHFDVSKREQTVRTADALSRELLYLKFIQGLPIVGMAGGISDMVYQKKITGYAALKYKRRFLAAQKRHA